MSIARLLLGLSCAAFQILALSACSASSDNETANNQSEETPLVRTKEAWTTLERALTAERPADRIETDVAYLAGDTLSGREAGTAGYKAAAGYVAARFQQVGLKPGINGSWFQQVPLRAARRDIEAASITITTEKNVNTTLIPLDDFIIGQSMAQAQFSLSAPVTFVGYGVSARNQNHDDYAGLDVRGKIVVAFNDAPVSFNSEERAFYRSYDYKLKTAAANGAIGFIAIPTKADLKRYSWARRAAGAKQKSMTWLHPDGMAEISAHAIKATASLSPSGADKLFSEADKSFDELQEIVENNGSFKGFSLNKTVALKGASIFEETTSPNVAGFLPGSDPKLKKEIVVLSAHLDHVGVSEPTFKSTKQQSDPDKSDYINNGALDNAMGVAAMLEAAKQFSQTSAPKRSILFLAVTAEEKGLIGSDYFAHYPSLPKGSRIVANVNLDMPLTLYDFNDIIAFGAERSSLGETVRQAASKMNIALVPDPFPDQGIFTRSDHYRFVEQGVPSVFLFLGQGNGGDSVFGDYMANHYHQPSDQPDLPIDYAAAARFATLNYEIARAIADDDKAPHWLDGDFFGERFNSAR